MFKNSLQIVGLMYAKLNHTTEDTAFVSHKVDLNKQNSTPEPPSHITGFEVGGPPSPEPANGEPTANCSSHFRHEWSSIFTQLDICQRFPITQKKADTKDLMRIFCRRRSIALLVRLSARPVRHCWGFSPISGTAPELSPPKPRKIQYTFST